MVCVEETVVHFVPVHGDGGGEGAISGNLGVTGQWTGGCIGGNIAVQRENGTEGGDWRPIGRPLWNFSSRNRVTPVSIQDGV